VNLVIMIVVTLAWRGGPVSIAQTQMLVTEATCQQAQQILSAETEIPLGKEKVNVTHKVDCIPVK
jgi:hypothetical protein